MSSVVINPDEDYGTVDEAEAAMFLNNVRKTETIVRAAQKERGAKEGELVVRAVMENFWSKENGRNVASSEPPKPDERVKLDGSGKYNAGIPLQATIEEFDRYIHGLCEKRQDGQPGWRIKWTVSYFAQAKAFLLNQDETPSARVVAAWQVHPIPEDDVQAYGLKEAALQHGVTEEGLPNDTMSVRIRQCVTRDGLLVKELWTNVNRGDSARFKAPDSKPQENLLRAQGPSGAHVVQQSSPLIFNNVVPTIYVTFDDAASATADANNAAAAAAGGVPALPPSSGTAAAAAPSSTGATTNNKKGGAAPAKKREASLGMVFCYECKGSVLLRENKEASDLCESERMHFSRNKDAHQLVPIHLLRSGSVTLPKTIYFFVAPRYITRWNPEHPDFWPKGSQGISLFRNQLQQHDFKTTPTAAGDVFYSFIVDLAVFQWTDKPNTQERYVVNARVRRDDDSIWRSWGITNGEAYAAIMLANQDIPFHAVLNFWKKATMERPANDPKEMNRNEGTENIRGYYDFIIDKIVPDYRRYFPARGMRVSRAFVDREFENYKSMIMKTKTTVIALLPYNKMHKRENPLHTQQGLASAVLSLGNGQPPPSTLPKDWPALTTQEGYYHGCKGDITHLFATEGRYQFYVLTSRPLVDEERAKYCGPNGVEADEWLSDQIERAAKSQSTFYYWIFALDTQSKIAKQEQPKVIPVTQQQQQQQQQPISGTKREREEPPVDETKIKVAHTEDDLEEDGEEVEEIE